MASQELRSVIAAIRESGQKAALAQPPTIEEMRRGTSAFLASFPEVPGVSVTAVDIAGISAEWNVPRSAIGVEETLLYFHGGGYVDGSAAGHRRITASLAVAAGVRSLSVDYRLAPEHPFPAALDDAVAAYEWLIGPGGCEASQVVVGGDSAGGGLAAALLVRLRDEGRPLPAGACLFSPLLDLAGTGESVGTRADADPMVSAAVGDMIVALYVQGEDVRNPYISPLYADLTGLPPLLLHVGDAEILLDDSTRMAERGAAAGVEVELEVWPEAFHVFQIHVGIIPEADDSIAKAGSWIAGRLGAVSDG